MGWVGGDIPVKDFLLLLGADALMAEEQIKERRLAGAKGGR